MPQPPVERVIEGQILKFLSHDEIILDNHILHCTPGLFKNLSEHWQHGDFVRAEIINGDEIRSFVALTPTFKKRSQAVRKKKQKEE